MTDGDLSIIASETPYGHQQGISIFKSKLYKFRVGKRPASHEHVDSDSNTNNTPGITRNKYKGLNHRKEKEKLLKGMKKELHNVSIKPRSIQF